MQRTETLHTLLTVAFCLANERKPGEEHEEALLVKHCMFLQLSPGLPVLYSPNRTPLKPGELAGTQTIHRLVSPMTAMAIASNSLF
jgi:hypothetical protein